MKSFKTEIEIIGINPYMEVPTNVLKVLFKEAEKDTSPIRVRGTLDGHKFEQTVVKYQGKWRLYLNTPMREAADLEVGDTATAKIEFNPELKVEKENKKFLRQLASMKIAKAAFKKLAPYHQAQIHRYLNMLKSEDTLKRNIETVILHLEGKEAKTLYALMRRKPKNK
jgi:hypothetical protein